MNYGIVKTYWPLVHICLLIKLWTPFWGSSADQSQPPCALCRNRKNENFVDNSVISNCLTISMKNVSLHSTERKIFFSWQGRFDHRTYEMMTSIEIVDNIVFLTCLSVGLHINNIINNNFWVYWKICSEHVYSFILSNFVPNLTSRIMVYMSNLNRLYLI